MSQIVILFREYRDCSGLSESAGWGIFFPCLWTEQEQKKPKKLEARNGAPGWCTGRNSAELSQKSSQISAEPAVTGKNRSLIWESRKHLK